jgi:hypothetical protein
MKRKNRDLTFNIKILLKKYLNHQLLLMTAYYSIPLLKK